jgi:hypothetical protein
MSQTAPVTIPALGTPPSTANPANFDTLADAFLASLPANSAGINAAALVTYNNAVDAYNNAVAGAASASAAAASQVNVAALANFKGTWSSLAGAIAKPASVFNNGAYWALLNNLADVTTSQPGVTADWQVVGGAFPIVPINSNTTAVPWKTYLIYGACTLTLPAISGNGKQVGVIVLPGVVGAILAPAGTDKVRNTTGNMTFDAPPFNNILNDTGVTYGWA